MSRFCAAHRVPRVADDPIDDAERALDVIQGAMSLSPREQTIVIVLDDDHRRRVVLVVDDTDEDDALLGVVERIVELADATVAAIVVASIRPGRGLVAADADRWLEAADVCDDAGIELLEWFVVQTDGSAFLASCPRDLVAVPPRWRRR